ncbi:MAG TPA: hypothetical protein VGR16_01080 [Thermomicrobiales bacterium]|nr:hypothetical protein [Thermomicrobiales bacterium]
MDGSKIPAVLAEAQAELAELMRWLVQTPELDVGMAETATLARVRTVGAHLLAAGLAARGTGKAPGPRLRGDGSGPHPRHRWPGEAKRGMVIPVVGEQRGPARYAASFEPPEAFGRRLVTGQVADLVAAWARLPRRGGAATVRDEHVISFTNQASRMADD